MSCQCRSSSTWPRMPGTGIPRRMVSIGARPAAAAACSILPPGRAERLRHDRLLRVRSRVAAAAVATWAPGISPGNPPECSMVDSRPPYGPRSRRVRRRPPPLRGDARSHRMVLGFRRVRRGRRDPRDSPSPRQSVLRPPGEGVDHPPIAHRHPGGRPDEPPRGDVLRGGDRNPLPRRPPRPSPAGCAPKWRAEAEVEPRRWSRSQAHGRERFSPPLPTRCGTSRI